jgi:hypothetical protein
MACYTQEDIAEQEGISQPQVKEIVSEMANLPEPIKLLADHKTDYEQPLYNVWKFKNKTNAVSHFGNSEVTIVDNLLAKYTKPYDVVVDQGGGVALGHSPIKLGTSNFFLIGR